MGTCGCADFDAEVKFPGPDGITYALEIYQSCHYCPAPAGVVVYRFEAGDDIGEEFLELVRDAEFPGGQLAVPVLEPAKLVEALGFVYEDDDIEFDIQAEEVAHALPEAVRLTLQEWRRAVAAGAATPDNDSEEQT